MESMGVVVRRYIDFNSIPTFCPFFSCFSFLLCNNLVKAY